MIEYLDKDDKKLEKGFYIFQEKGDLFYFTGKYDEKEGFPLFEREQDKGEEKGLPVFSVRRLYKIAKQEAREKLQELKKKTNWLERRVEEEK